MLVKLGKPLDGSALKRPLQTFLSPSHSSISFPLMSLLYSHYSHDRNDGVYWNIGVFGVDFSHFNSISIPSLSLTCVLATSWLAVPGFQVEAKGYCKPGCSSAFTLVQHCRICCGFILCFSHSDGGRGMLFVVLSVVCVI